MAKYTTLLAEYLERGGQLPASFALIDGFEDLFKKHYCDKELGFETDLLFFMKVDELADIYLPLYQAKLQRLAAAWLNYDAPAKVTYTTENKTFNGGELNGSTTELPFNSLNADPNILTHNDAYENSEERGLETRETGKTIDEAQKAIEFLNEKVHSLIEELLKVFKQCFMAVY